MLLKVLEHHEKYGVAVLFVYFFASMLPIVAMQLVGMLFSDITGLNEEITALVFALPTLMFFPIFYVCGFMIAESMWKYFGPYYILGVDGFPIRDKIRNWVGYKVGLVGPAIDSRE